MKKILFGFTYILFAGTINAQFDWKNTGGPFGAGISFLFSNDQYAFIPKNDFLYRSSDGLSWEHIDIQVSFKLATHGSRLVNIYFDKDPANGHLQLSEDNGETWNLKTIPNELDAASSDIVLCSHGLYIFRYSPRLLYRSTDLGDSWQLIPIPSSGYEIFALEDRLYLKGSAFLARTDVYGENWEEITPPLVLYEYISDIVSQGSSLMITTGGFAPDPEICAVEFGYIWISHTNGLIWEKELAITGNSYNIIEKAGDFIYQNIQNFLLRSGDFGISWDTIWTLDPLLGISDVVGLGNKFLCSTAYQGVFSWDEASHTMLQSNEGLSKGWIADMDVSGDQIWASCGDGIYQYDLKTESWSIAINLPSPGYPYDFITTNDQGWIAVARLFSDHFHFSENNGISWATIYINSYPAFGILHLELLNDNLLVIDDFEAKLSTDKGENWNTLFDELIETHTAFFNGRYYMASRDLLHSSSNDGLTWESTMPPFKIVSLGAYATELYAVTFENNKTKLYISRDGHNWIFASDGFPENYSFGIFNRIKTPFYRDTDHYYAFNAGLNGQSYRSALDPIFWEVLPTTQYGSDYVFVENQIYLGGEGMYKAFVDNPFVTSVQNVTKSNLFKISPNPTSGFIALELDPAFDFNGSVRIFSHEGQLVKAFYIDSSKKRFTLSLHEIPNGLYLIVLNGNTLSAVNSFVMAQ